MDTRLDAMHSLQTWTQGGICDTGRYTETIRTPHIESVLTVCRLLHGPTPPLQAHSQAAGDCWEAPWTWCM